MPLDGKNFDLDVFGFPNLQTGSHPKSNLLAFSQPDRWPQDVKTFKLDVFKLPDLEFEGFNILGSSSWMLKVSFLMFFDSQNSKPGNHPKIKASSIQSTCQMASGC